MADEAVTVLNLSANTASADLIVDTEGGQSIADGDTAVITIDDTSARYIFSFGGAGAPSVVVEAGDDPPAIRAGLGPLAAFTKPAADLLIMVLDFSRFLQNNATIRITPTGAACIIGCHKIPKSV